jgi:hypothetical protein
VVLNVSPASAPLLSVLFSETWGMLKVELVALSWPPV